MFNTTDISYLLHALSLAKQGKGHCMPNPAVGAVLVKNGIIIASGYHRKCGENHAEREALGRISSQEGLNTTLYITLEPCCHYGRTPPCTELIIEKKIKKVVYAYQDPDKRVTGKGREALLQAGVECEYVFVPEIEAFYRSYAWWQKHKMPYVTAKLAMSVDGKIAGKNGEQIKITGLEIDKFTHQQRTYTDAILTTSATIKADDPQFNARYNNIITAKKIYILDRYLDLPFSSQLFRTAEQITCFYQEGVTTDFSRLQTLSGRGVQCVPVIPTKIGLYLKTILAYLGEEGIHDCWVEAGSRCITALLEHNLVQQMYLYISPKILGSETLNGFHQPFDFTDRAKTIEWEIFGQDILCKMVIA